MGPGLLPILYALKDTAAFFIVTVMSLLAATHAYYNLQIKDDEKRKRENGDERTVVFFLAQQDGHWYCFLIVIPMFTTLSTYQWIRYNFTTLSVLILLKSPHTCISRHP